MTGGQVRRARTNRAWTQADLAARLRVSQGYVSLLERGARPVPPTLAASLGRLLDVPPSALPVAATTGSFDGDTAARALSALGYLRFADRPSRRERRNPAEVVLRCLRATEVETRVAEALVWLLVAHADLDWSWLVRHSKADDLQNRLGFLVSLAVQVAKGKGDAGAAARLTTARTVLDRSRLAGEGAFRASMPAAERRWLRDNRPPEAAYWNLLTTMRVADLPDAA